MRRIISTGVGARKSLAEGARKLAEAVGSTLGPHGQTFFLDKKNTITNDGISVAKEFQLNDEVENRGVTALREPALKTVDEVGDGTTTTIILAHKIYEAASKLLGDADTIGGKKTGAELIKEIEVERQEITKKLIASATPITSEEELIASARVSSGDETLGNLIGSTQWKLGKQGVLIAEETAESESSVEIVNGIRLDNGLVTSLAVNNFEKHSFESNDIKVILTSYTIHKWEQVVPILTALHKSGATGVVVMARAFTEEAVKGFMRNLEAGGFPAYPMNAGYTNMAEVFQDVAALTGAKYFDSEASDLKDMQLSDVGFARRIVVERFNTVITGIDDEKSKERISKRVEALELKLKGEQSEFMKKGLLARIAQLQSGFGIVKVGSQSDMERKRLFDKADDAVGGVRAAFLEGTVKGAGLAFKEIADSLPNHYILKCPLMAPYEQIMSTAPANFKIEDWVRDPVKVLRIALEHACTTAASFATAGGVITAEFNRPLDDMFRKNMPTQE